MRVLDNIPPHHHKQNMPETNDHPLVKFGRLIYSDGQKSCTFFSNFIVPPPGGVGPILELVNSIGQFCEMESKIGPHPPGGPTTKSEKKCVGLSARHCIV